MEEAANNNMCLVEVEDKMLSDNNKHMLTSSNTKLRCKRDK